MKDAGIFNMRALQIDFHPRLRVQKVLSHCLFKFSFHVWCCRKDLSVYVMNIQELSHHVLML